MPGCQLPLTPGRVSWCDFDTGHSLNGELPLVKVESGSPGHQHVYVLLDTPTDPATIETLNYRLAKWQGGEKWERNALLRMPGTISLKPGAGPVRITSVPLSCQCDCDDCRAGRCPADWGPDEDRPFAWGEMMFGDPATWADWRQ